MVRIDILLNYTAYINVGFETYSFPVWFQETERTGSWTN